MWEWISDVWDGIDWSAVGEGAWDWVSSGWGDDEEGGAGSLPWEQIVGAGLGGYDAAKGTPGTPPTFLPGQEQAYGTAFGAAQDLWNQGPAEYYPDSTVAPRNPLQTFGENMQLQNLGNLQGLADGSYGAAQALQQGGASRIADYALPGQIGFELPQEYADAIMNPIINTLNEDLLPGLHTQAQAQGAFGGSRATQQRADAINRTTGTATDALIRGNLLARQQSIGQRAGDISAMVQQRGQNINQNQIANQAMMQGINGATIAQNQQLIPGDVARNIGAERSAYDQSVLNEDVKRWNYNQTADEQLLNQMFGWLSGTAQPSGGTAGTPGGDWLDILKGVIQGSNTGGGLANGASTASGGAAEAIAQAPGAGIAPVSNNVTTMPLGNGVVYG